MNRPPLSPGVAEVLQLVADALRCAADPKRRLDEATLRRVCAAAAGTVEYILGDRAPV